MKAVHSVRSQGIRGFYCFDTGVVVSAQNNIIGCIERRRES